MMIAIFSDVHGNLPALERFVEKTRRVADSYICLGDVVNYGPWNDECLELVHSLPGITFIEGNHERLFLGTEPVEQEAELVRQFYEHSIRHFRRRDLITGLPGACDLGPFICTHTIDHKKVYADTQIAVTRSHIIGHTHHQYMIERSGKSIVNPGSVGQNRARIESLNYALYDSASGEITLCEEPSPVDQLVAELIARVYPERCVNYYLGKRRSGEKSAFHG
jgi:predicted phosphodiesterase